MISTFKQLDIFKNLHYILGLALQKGLPYLLIPLIAWKFGLATYSNFIVIYAITQITALLISLGTPSAFIVFWHQAENKSLYTASSLLILLLTSFILALPAAWIIHEYIFPQSGFQTFGVLLFFILSFSFAINLNTLGLNLLRAQSRAKEYFICVCFTSLLLCISITLSPKTINTLSTLMFINLSVLLIQSFAFVKASSVRLVTKPQLTYTWDLTKSIIHYSFTFTLYSLLSLSMFTVDKWLIKAFFPAEELAQYVINFQLAFIVNIISIVVGMYSLPIFCQLVNEKSFALFRHKLLQNYGLTIAVSTILALGTYIYAAITHLHLTQGYWLLALAFLFTNLFTVNVSVFESFKKVKSLFLLTLFFTTLFWGVFALSLDHHSLFYIYLNYIVYYFLLFLTSWLMVTKMTNPNNKQENKSIAILYDCPYPFIQGGGQKRFYKIAQYLLAQGWKIDWLCLKFWEGENTIEQDGIRYISVGKKMDLYNASGKRSLKEALYYGFCVAKHRSLAKYSIIHAGQWPYFHLFPARLCTLFNKTQFVIDWWEVWDKEWKNYAGKKSFLGRALEKIASRLTKHMITISELGKNQLFQIRKPNKSITVIHNGIDFHAIKNISAQGNTTDLCYLGRLKNHKNVDVLLHAIALLKQEGSRLTATIIGDGPERPALETLAQQLDIQQQIQFLGQVDADETAYAYIKSSRLFIHPSTKEGGGSITTLEANACGLPVIAFIHPHGISREFIENGQNGYWVEEFSAQALAKTIQMTLTDYNKLSTMSQAAIKFVQRFDWNIIGNNYHQYFHQLTQQHG